MALDRLLQSQLAWLKDGKANLSVLKLDGIEFKDLKFPNSESYRGGWKDNRVRRRCYLCSPAMAAAEAAVATAAAAPAAAASMLPAHSAVLASKILAPPHP